MKILYLFFLLIMIPTAIKAQTYNQYKISFKNAVHHEAIVEAEFSNLENNILELRMSRTSPGRYALHEFVKNVYDIKATDSKGNNLTITRPDPYRWLVDQHDGTVKITYTLFGNRGDGTYTQIDETHAHLNIPATFIYASNYTERPIKVIFEPREDLNWKIASQLIHQSDNSYSAPNLQYFMDSPTELSDHIVKSFKVKSNQKEYTIKFALHHNGTEEEVDTYFEKVKKVVRQEMKVFGEFPDFDFGTYTFLACYIPNASGDGMEHRNSTILTSTMALADGGMERNIGTVSHEFFHAWNVERIRPKTLEPFNFKETNMSGELWFAEGFTSYYTNLILCRAGIITAKKYIEGLVGNLNYVWNSPARNFFNPIEMSYQAPFVDAARSVDPVNRENTFISYYSYGSVLGLALDLSLRNLNGDKNLDDFMKLVWQTYGKTEISYTIKDLQNVLNEYAGKDFSENFFSKYIYNSKMPDYKKLFSSVGVEFKKTKNTEAYLGASLSNKNGKWVITSNPKKGYAAYKAGLSYGDEIVSFDNHLISEKNKLNDIFNLFKPKQKVKVVFNRFGIQKETQLIFDKNPLYVTSLIEKTTNKVAKRKEQWLKSKSN